MRERRDDITRDRRLTARPSTIAAALCGVVAIIAATVGSSANVTVSSEIAGSARGAFDILVRPAGADDLNAASTRGLIEPDYLSFAGGGGISLAQVAKIGSLPGVSVAAPISVVGQVAGSWSTPLIALPATATSRVEDFTVTQRVSDGVTNRVVSRQSFRVLLPRSDSVTAASTGGGSSVAGDAKSGWLVAALPLPPVTSSVVAVDPIAEEHLLGHHVAALTQLAELRDRSSGTFTAKSLISAIGSAIAHGRLAGAGDVQAAVPLGSPFPAVPVIVTATDATSGSLTVTGKVLAEGSTVDQALSGSNARAALSAWPDDTDPISTTTATSAADLEPLQPSALTIGLGTKADTSLSAGGAITQITGLLIDRPDYSDVGTTADGLHVRITPHVLVDATGPKIPILTDPGAGVGTVRATGKEWTYRSSSTVRVQQSVSLYPIRTFTAASLVPTSPDQGRVSLGAYDIPALTVTDSRLAAKGTRMRQTLDPAGLVVRQPAGIADIRDATLLRGSRPVDAVRVRVAGISAVTPAAIRRVEAVAGEIAGMGLKVNVVIGSSPQKVSITVPKYVDAHGDTVPLGTVSQNWTTLGAATRVSNGLATTTLALVALAAATALLAALAAQLVDASAFRREAAILRIAGWSRTRIRRRLLRRPLLVSGIAAAALACCWAFTARDVVTGGIGLALCALTPLSVAITSRSAVRTSPLADARVGDTRALLGRHPSSSTGLAVRLSLASPVRTVAIGALVAVTVASAAFAAALYGSRAALAGPTLLADGVTFSLTGDHLALAAVAVVIGFVFATLLWRHDIRMRARDHRLLAVVGWTRRDLHRLTARLLLQVAVPGVLVGAAASIPLAALTDAPPTPLITVAVALVCGLCVTALMGAATRKAVA